jgi:hypothetical protein
MKNRFLSIVFFLPFIVPGHIQATQSISSLWQTVGTGIEYREFYLPQPDHVYVARMDRSNPQVTLDSSIAQGKLSGGLETVREMAKRYDQAINYWGETWGGRNQVVVAINGYFYDPETGIPTGGQVHSGWYAKRFEDKQSGSGFAWTLDRNAFIGGCVVHPPAKQVITFLASGGTMTFDGINVPRGENQLIIYTPQYDATTLTDEKGIEVLVELSRPLIILAAPAMVEGVVREIRDGEGSTLIPFDHVVLSANGTAGDRLREIVNLGEQIGISQEIKHFETDCRTPIDVSWSKTYASVGRSYVFLKDGIIQRLGDLGAVLRSPRTAIAFNDRYVYFIVVDGRDRIQSLGMSMVEMAMFARNKLGATNGTAMDGGGSSTMVVNGELMNRPNTESSESGAIAPTEAARVSGKPGGLMQSTPIERAVANGMMMVVVLPKEQSTHYKTGDKVITPDAGETQVRLGPGTNYAVIAVIAPGSPGIILEHPEQMNGILAKGEYWWKVAFGEVSGWVSESSLIGP